MEGKLCALIRQTWFEAAKNNLSDSERLAFYEVCFTYEFTGEVPTRKSCPYSTVLLMFDMVKADLTADAEKARKIAERNRLNGSLGGRPPKSNNTLQEVTNPEKPKETQSKGVGYFGSPLHNTTQQNTTIKAEAAAASVLDGSFFDGYLWRKLDPEGRFRSRHRACLAMWLGFSDVKRKVIAKAVLSDVFAGGENPYFYLQDFAEPEPRFIDGREVERIWKEGGSVYQVEYNNKFRLTTEDEVKTFNLKVTKVLAPEQ